MYCSLNSLSVRSSPKTWSHLLWRSFKSGEVYLQKIQENRLSWTHSKKHRPVHDMPAWEWHATFTSWKVWHSSNVVNWYKEIANSSVSWNTASLWFSSVPLVNSCLILCWHHSSVLPDPLHFIIQELSHHLMLRSQSKHRKITHGKSSMKIVHNTHAKYVIIHMFVCPKAA